MKTMFKTILCLGVLSFLPLALAQVGSGIGGGVGNGGVSVVCRDASGAITSAELLDIYEGRELYQRTYASDNVSVDTKIQLMKLNLIQHTSLLKKFDDELSKVYANLVFVNYGNELKPTNDALPIIGKKGCKLEQVANYTNSGEVFVSQEIYESFDNLNQAALYVHEVFYSLYRKANRSEGKLNSRESRKLTAYLMALKVDSAVIEDLLKKHNSRVPGHKEPCGLEGSVAERILDCDSSNGDFALVSRTKSLKEVHMDTKTGLLWGDRLPSTMTHYQAQKACHEDLDETAGISGVTWRLPSIDQYKEADKHGIGIRYGMLPNMSYWFWSSSVHRVHASDAWVFSGGNGNTHSRNRYSGYSVRCVARSGARVAILNTTFSHN